MLAIYKAYERNAALILAAEKWADGYSDAPEQHGRLIKTAARLERKVLLFFKQQAAHADTFVNWYAYSQAINEVHANRIDAYDVEVIVNDEVEKDNQEFITVVFDDIALATALGAQAGEVVYGIPSGLDKTSASIQRQARKQVAELVGKKILDNGTVVDNPNAKYVISNTTRKNIQQSIHTSITLGEDIPAATKRIRDIIKSPSRAALIAHQETGMAYTTGLHMYGAASGAVGKEWQDNGAIDVCATYTKLGPIPFNQAYDNYSLQHPTAHIGCKCYERLIYQNELDNDPNLFSKA